MQRVLWMNITFFSAVIVVLQHKDMIVKLPCVPEHHVMKT